MYGIQISALIGHERVTSCPLRKLRQADEPTDQQTKQKTDMRVHRTVTLSIHSITIISIFLVLHFSPL